MPMNPTKPSRIHARKFSNKVEAATLNIRDSNRMLCIIKKTVAKLTFTSPCREKPLHIAVELFTQYWQMVVET